MRNVLALISMIAATVAFTADVPNLPRQDGRVDPRVGMGPRGSGFTAMMDADKDGKVTKQEVLAWFDKTDADKDGVLSQEELAALRPGRTGPGGPPEGNRPQGGPQNRNRQGQGGQRPQ